MAALATVTEQTTSVQAVSLSEIISALSFALDLTQDAVQGHAVRSCLLGTRIAHEIGLPDPLCNALYYALLLKDVGCSSNAARMCAIVGGDDRAMKAGVKLDDWTRPHRPTIRTARTLWRTVLPEANALHRAARIAKMGMTQNRNAKELIALRCDRGANIVRKLEFGELAAQAVYHLDEHWDGGGYPDHLKGDGVPVLSRICSVAQNLDAFCTEDGPEAAMKVLRQRSGRWFDPALVRAAESLHSRGVLWKNCGTFDNRNNSRLAVLDLDPAPENGLGPERVDEICEAFAEVVDAKSSFTYRHSLGVTEVAMLLAEDMGLRRLEVQQVRRASLLHDIGKLRVPNTILDKQGKLTSKEWNVLLEHPMHTRSILERVRAFRDLATLASHHHEKLDGSGYPWGLRSCDLTREARLLTVADMYSAMTEDRPYRQGMEPEKALGLLEKEVPHKLDGECFEALCAVVRRSSALAPVTEALLCAV